LKKQTQGWTRSTFSRFEANSSGVRPVEKTNPVLWMGLRAKEVFEKTNPLGGAGSDGAGDLKKQTQSQTRVKVLRFEANLDEGGACVNWEIEKTNPNWGRAHSFAVDLLKNGKAPWDHGGSGAFHETNEMRETDLSRKLECTTGVKGGCIASST